MTKIFLAIALVGLVVGFTVHNSMVAGAGKALFGVFFICAYIGKLGDWLSSERPETTHDHGGLMGKGGHGHGH